MPADQPHQEVGPPTELLVKDVKELGLPATGCLLAPWGVVLLVIHQLLPQRDRTARGVVEPFSQGHCDAHPFVPKHRTEAPLPPPPRGASDAFDMSCAHGNRWCSDKTWVTHCCCDSLDQTPGGGGGGGGGGGKGRGRGGGGGGGGRWEVGGGRWVVGGG